MTEADTAEGGITWNLQNKRWLGDLDYADDIVLITHTFTDMKNVLQRLTVWAMSAGLTINTQKTREMRIGTSTNNRNRFYIQGEEVEKVKFFCYLGCIITTNGGTEEDVSFKIRKARQAFASLRNVWSSNQVGRATKIRLFNSNVKSVLLCGCKTWRLTGGIVHLLQVFINKCLRRICRIFWPNTISNDRLHDLCGQTPIHQKIKKRKWR